ncbi:MAG TPA: hypothetical protein VGM58_10140 [Verrucomicrobiae bacterium]
MDEILTAVVVRMAVPPFWTAKPKGWTAMMGGVPNCAWLLAVKKPRKTKHIAISFSRYLLNLRIPSIRLGHLSYYHAQNLEMGHVGVDCWFRC